jgi:hypothetical protein
MLDDEEIEDRLEIMLDPVDGAYEPADTFPKQAANRVRDKVLAEPDEEMQEFMHDELRTAIASVVYGGHDPKFVPTEVMVHCIQNPVGGSQSSTEYDARNRVRNANTGIRAFCLGCMGGDRVLVRQCQTGNCPLWPFRMGGNPLYGRLVGSTGEEESNETAEEIEALDTGEGDD